jgi:hypothetical protein
VGFGSAQAFDRYEGVISRFHGTIDLNPARALPGDTHRQQGALMCVETIALAALLLRTAACLAPEQAGRFVASFRATFGGQSIRQVVAAVMPTASSTTSHLLRTPVGTVSLFGFSTPAPVRSARSEPVTSSPTSVLLHCTALPGPAR